MAPAAMPARTSRPHTLHNCRTRVWAMSMWPWQRIVRSCATQLPTCCGALRKQLWPACMLTVTALKGARPQHPARGTRLKTPCHRGLVPQCSWAVLLSLMRAVRRSLFMHADLNPAREAHGACVSSRHKHSGGRSNVSDAM